MALKKPTHAPKAGKSAPASGKLPPRTAKIATTAKPTAKAPTPSKALTKPSTPTGSTAVATRDERLRRMAGMGLKDVGAGDISLPRLTILQALSPQINAKKAEHLEGAEVGHICDVGVGELFDEPVIFLPVDYKKMFIEWQPRERGGGLVKIYNDASIMEQTSRGDREGDFTNYLPNGNHVVETAQFYGFNLSTEDMRACFIPMVRSQLKKAQKWLGSMIRQKITLGDGSAIQAPMFHRVYKLDTVEETSPKGEFAGWRVVEDGTLEAWCESHSEDFDLWLDRCEQFYNTIQKGRVQGDHRGMETDAGSAPAGDTGADGADGGRWERGGEERPM